MNMTLKLALVERGLPAYKTAWEAGINPIKVSKIISGLQEPTEAEKEDLARVLKRPVDILFPTIEPIEAA